MTGQAKPKNRPTDCPAPSPFQPGLLSLTTPKKASLMLPRATTARGTVALTNVLPNAPSSGVPNPAERSAPASSLASDRSCAGDGDSWENQTRVVSPEARAAAGAPGRRQSLTRLALPHAGHGLFPPRRERPSGPGPCRCLGAGTVLAVLTVGTLPPPPQCPLRAFAAPPRAPASPPRPAGGCAGLGAAAPARKAPRPRRPAPHLRACG